MDNNPYASPQAAVADHYENATYAPKIFAINGRIGRLRYLAYGVGLSMLVTIVAVMLIGALAGISGKAPMTDGTLRMGLFTAFYVPALAVSFIMMKRRFNDLDKSGWWSLLMLIPFINIIVVLYLTFGAGSPGGNRFGPAPGKNSTGVVVAALFVPIIVILGIVAAVSIPAYQAYVKRAQEAQTQQALPQETWQQSQ